ncbi:Bis(5'-nucleosyl)-tetraphosphatase PrpE [asymmetrical] [Thalassovita gelatinovora]|uniref:Bis(5'-nucleosyl)-tetraphosphatase PrpE [asymmetrical] n=1 Tax=Thalassovita gelatinovora TaxID=53501 RepID=A0A0P1F9E0_THAGE|nr:metallophosphoesterase family protein [Thalassovita gelatinovora]QIZ81238.1 serine/threonine protein phosphatase [Thalassovita gelatinovora]CUH64649.1 Bis(5'-nucleosyl)-tetraphosphatase PrpE [asymmetrical] [Thalassovita gelatinovora]SEP94276.1 serine/threonine protein phosphatase 1 [Thalassovita gelatinovora]
MQDTPIYAVGDIHGYLDQLDWAIDLIEKDGGEDAQVVFLGDLVDRGPDSRSVIDRLMAGIEAGRNWAVLRGNHDEMFRNFLESGTVEHHRMRPGMSWPNERVGGLATLGSYGVEDLQRSPEILWKDSLERVPHRHLEFLKSLPFSREMGDYLFVHAGIRPELPLDRQDPQDLIWIRNEFLDYTDPHPWLVVHGHTHRPTAEHHGNRINLDSGAGYGQPITAAVFEGRKAWTLTPFGREKLGS